MISPAVREERRCACGCPASMDGKRKDARYATKACRMLAYKQRHKITGIRYRKASQNASQQKPEQPRVRYDIAVEAAQEACGLFLTAARPIDHLPALAEECVRKRLTARQREALDQRQAQAQEAA